jgi:uncharacterized protein (TIGR02117 family)
MSLAFHKMKTKKVGRFLLKSTAGILILISIYFVAAFGLAAIPSNSNFLECKKDAVEIFVRSNGVHTDLVLPMQNDIKSWSAFISPNETKAHLTNAKYVAFGWGDKGFYLETPTWNDLKFKTAFKALFFLSSTAMHVTFYEDMSPSESCKKICISRESYLKLVRYIGDSFVTESGSPKLIKGAGYGNNDLFYDAVGTYSLFYTCNTWTNCGLKDANLKACVWTPFDGGILDKY